MSLLKSLCLVAGLTTLTACIDDQSPSVVGEITLHPDTADLAVGETSVHRISVLDQRGDPMPAEWPPRVEWTLADPSRADLEVDGDELRVTAKVKGSVLVEGQLGNVERRFRLWAHPLGLTEIAVEPDPVVLGAGGRARRLAIRLYDADGQEMNPLDFRLSYQVEDTTLAVVTSLPAVRAPREDRTGTTRLVALASGMTGTADIVVTLEPGPLDDAPSAEATSMSEVALSWSSSIEARSGYEVERANDAAGPWGHLASTAYKASYPWLDTTYVDAGLDPGATYYYRVRPCNQHGCSVEPSPVGSGTTAGGSEEVHLAQGGG